MISTSMRAIVELSPREPIVWTPVAPAVAPLPYCAGGSYLSAGPAACMTVAESVNLTRSAFAHCQQPFSWPQITRSNETMVRTGGLGELLEVLSEPSDAVRVHVIRRLVEQEQLRLR